MPATNLLGTGQDLDNSSPTVFAEFKLVRDEIAVMVGSARHVDLPMHTGPTWRGNDYGRLVALNQSDGVDMAQAQALSDTGYTVSPGDVGVQVLIPGTTLRRTADTELEMNVGQMMGNAYGLKEDTDGINQLTSFTTATLGAAATVMSPGLAAAAGAALRVGNSRATPEPAPKPWILLLNPMSGVPLEGRLIPYATTPAGGTAYGQNTGAHVGTSVTLSPDPEARRMIREGVGAVGQIAGMVLKYDANALPDASDDVVTAGWSREGLLYCEEVAAHPAHDRDDKSQRGAVEYNFWGAYGWGVHRPAAFGRLMTVDASAATS